MHYETNADMRERYTSEPTDFVNLSTGARTLKTTTRVLLFLHEEIQHANLREKIEPARHYRGDFTLNNPACLNIPALDGFETDST